MCLRYGELWYCVSQLEMFAMKERLEEELRNSTETVQRLRMEGDKLAVEVRHLRDEVTSQAAEIKINAGWKARYQKDSAKHDSLKKQIVRPSLFPKRFEIYGFFSY
jgi:FtsZ-binding cell division protein ZapB